MWWWDEHILPVLNNAKYARNKAAVAVDWDSGTRSGEFRSMKVGDVGDHKYGKEITVNGRRGQRSVTLITSVPYPTLVRGSQKEMIQKRRSGATWIPDAR